MPSEQHSDNQNPIDAQSSYSSSRQPNRSVGASHLGSDTIESPELLRWRADLLLDEMLLGGADVGTGHLYNGSGSMNGYNGQSHAANGHHSPVNHSTNGMGQTPSDAPRIESFYPRVESNPTIQPLPQITPSFPMTDHSAGVSQQSLLVSAEQRYMKRSEPAPNLPNGNGSGAEAVRESAEQLSLVEPQPSQGLGPVRRSNVNGSSVSSAMSVAARGSKYSTLLPRESKADPEILQREISQLGAQLATEMPPHHESRERAQKLLDKANTILQSDPMRSAEVDYYLQQVRAMMERLRQSLTYSELYQRRLRTYLFAWLMLALIVIIGSFAYAKELINVVSLLANWRESNIGSQHLVALILTLFTGGLGGTLCALWSLRTLPHRESGFLDRKFSLRNMILPITGLVAGLFIYFLLGLSFWVLGVDPSSHLWLAFIPMLVTFLLATGQEYLFGLQS